MTTSASVNYNATRTQIITRAMLICHLIGEGETPTSTQLSQYSIDLNHLLHELNTDGMPLWNLRNYTVTLILSTATYQVGIGAGTNAEAPLKIIQAWNRDLNTSADTPVLVIDRAQYNLLGNKTSPGTPNQLWYDIPRAIQASGEAYGTVTLYPVPDAYAVANKQLMFVGQKPFDDMDSATDTLDLPQYWMNAVVWGLADQIAYPGALPFAERAMISKKAQMHREAALSFGTEEGSITFAATPRWE